MGRGGESADREGDAGLWHREQRQKTTIPRGRPGSGHCCPGPSTWTGKSHLLPRSLSSRLHRNADRTTRPALLPPAGRWRGQPSRISWVTPAQVARLHQAPPVPFPGVSNFPFQRKTVPALRLQPSELCALSSEWALLSEIRKRKNRFEAWPDLVCTMTSAVLPSENILPVRT